MTQTQIQAHQIQSVRSLRSLRRRRRNEVSVAGDTPSGVPGGGQFWAAGENRPVTPGRLGCIRVPLPAVAAACTSRLVRTVDTG